MMEFLETKPVSQLKAVQLILQRLEELGGDENVIESFQQIVETLQRNETLLARRDLAHTKEDVIQDVDSNLSAVVENVARLATSVVSDVAKPPKKKRKIGWDVNYF